MVDCTVNKLFGIMYDVLVKVSSFIFLGDFVILNCEVNFNSYIILERPSLATRRALIDIEIG